MCCPPNKDLFFNLVTDYVFSSLIPKYILLTPKPQSPVTKKWEKGKGKMATLSRKLNRRGWHQPWQ